MAKENRRKVSIDIVGAKLFAVAFMVVAAIALLGSTASFASCTAKDDNAASQYEQTTFIPQAPDYNDATMWVTSIAAILGFTASVWRRTSKSVPRSGESCTSRLSPAFRNAARCWWERRATTIRCSQCSFRCKVTKEALL